MDDDAAMLVPIGIIVIPLLEKDSLNLRKLITFPRDTFQALVVNDVEI
jgi:hypothetical protein